MIEQIERAEAVAAVRDHYFLETDDGVEAYRAGGLSWDTTPPSDGFAGAMLQCVKHPTAIPLVA